MLLPKPIAEGVRDGVICLAFRRWDAPRVKVGGQQLTMAGIVRFDAVEEVAGPEAVSDADAAAAGFAGAEGAAKLRALLAVSERKPSPRGGKGGDKIFKIYLSHLGPDPRWELREKKPSRGDYTEIDAALDKLDAGKKTGPWTRSILRWIRDNPGVISTELATLLGREVLPMKNDIRKMKALGLTISLPVGYQLSPRGAAYLRWADRRDKRDTKSANDTDTTGPRR